MHKSLNYTPIALSVALATQALVLPTPVVAQESIALEEVVVTARRRAENLQDVPVSVSAFGTEQLENLGIGNITELQQRLPNTTLQVSRATNTTLTAYIRGIGQQDPLWGFEPGVGIYIDDVYIARPQGAVLEVLDVENIEVLRGPQGTLYGKNTIGGALKYQTRKLDTENAHAAVNGTFGTENQRDIKLSGSVPITDTLVIGGAYASLNRDGFGVYRNTGDDNYDKDISTWNVKVQFTPSDNLSLVFAYDKTEDDSNPRGGHRLTRSLITGQEPYGNVYDSDTSLSDRNSVETEGFSGTLTWDINEQLTFKWIGSLREGDTYTSIDFDSTSANSFDVPAIYDDEQMTHELQLSFSGDRLSGVAGVYYYDGEACGAFDVILGFGGITLENGGCVETESYSAYAQGSFDITDALSVSVGGRYTKDDKAARVYRHVFLGSKFPEQTGTPFAVQTDFTDDESWNEFTPHVGIQYHLADDIMLYGSFTTGFKSGGFDMRANASVNPNANDAFDPETVMAWEGGIKSTLLDGRLRLNLAVFYNEYEDMQVTVQRAVGTTDFASQVVNAGESEMKGFEIEMHAALSESLSLAMGMGYIDAEFVSVETFDPNLQRTVDVSDLWVISNTPEVSANIALTHSTEIGSWALTSTAGAAYRGKTHIFEIPSRLDEDSYTLFNLSVVAVSPDEKWSVGLHGKNLSDEEYRVAGYNFAATFDDDGNLVAPGLGGEDTVTAFYGDPRTVSLTLGYRF